MAWLPYAVTSYGDIARRRFFKIRDLMTANGLDSKQLRYEVVLGARELCKQEVIDDEILTRMREYLDDWVRVSYRDKNRLQRSSDM